MVALPKNCIPAAVQIAQFESVSLENSRFSRPKKSQKKKEKKKAILWQPFCPFYCVP
jgi:hypothetical protein